MANIRFNPVNGFLQGDKATTDKIQTDIASMASDISEIKNALGKDSAKASVQRDRMAQALRGRGNRSRGQNNDVLNTNNDAGGAPAQSSNAPSRAAQERGAGGRFKGKKGGNPDEPKPAEPTEKNRSSIWGRLTDTMSRLRESISGNSQGLDPVIDAVHELSGITKLAATATKLGFKAIVSPFKLAWSTYKFFKPNKDGISRAGTLFNGWRKRAQDRQQRTLEKIVSALRSIGFGSAGGGGSGLPDVDIGGGGSRRRGGRGGRGWRRGVGRLGRYARGGGLVGAALGAFALGDIMTDDSLTGGQKVHQSVNLGGSVAGGIGGAAMGAAVGTAIFPVVGTVIGGLIGGWLGSKGGEVVADKAQNMIEQLDLTGFAADSARRIGSTISDFYDNVVKVTSETFESIANTFKKGTQKGEDIYSGAVDATSRGIEAVANVGSKVGSYLGFGGDSGGGAVGKGNLHDRSVATARAYKAGNVGGLDDANTRQLVASVVSTESSGGNISAKNNLGYYGRYQTGASYLAKAGMIAGGDKAVLAAKKADGFEGKSDWAWGESGGQTRFLQNSANWKDGMSLDKYRASPELQDQAFKAGASSDYSDLVKKGLITANTPPNVVRGLLKAAHLGGVGGASVVARGGKGSRDANGTYTSDYARQGASNAFADAVITPTATAPTVTAPQMNTNMMATIPTAPTVTVETPRMPIASTQGMKAQKGGGKPQQQVSNPRLAQIATGNASNAKL